MKKRDPRARGALGGCVRRWKAPTLTKTGVEQGTMTRCTGLVRSPPCDQGPQRAQYSQRCQRCFEGIERHRDQVAHWPDGWCHAGCGLERVIEV